MTERKRVGMDIQFVKGEEERARGSAFVYTVDSCGIIIARFASSSSIDFQNRRIVPEYNYLDDRYEPEMFASRITAQKESDLTAGLEDVLKVIPLSLELDPEKLVACGVLYYSEVLKKMGAHPVAGSIVKRYHQFSPDEFREHIASTYIAPITYATGFKDQKSIALKLVDFSKFVQGAPFLETAKAFVSRLRDVNPSNGSILELYVKIMAEEYKMSLAAGAENFDEAIRARDELKRLNVLLKAAR